MLPLHFTRMSRAVLLTVALLTVSLTAQEVIMLPAPVTTLRTQFQLTQLTLTMLPSPQIVVELESNDGFRLLKTYTVADGAVALLANLNTANLSTTCATQLARNCGSLRRRIYDRLRDDKVITGDVQ